MIARVSTRLEVTPDEGWRLVRKTATMLHVLRGLVGLAGARQLPEEWREGLVVRSRLLMLHLVPAWVHEIRIARLDDEARELWSEERGGPVRSWRHRIRVEEGEAGCCCYIDEVHVRAGVLTPLAWLLTQVLFRYRQARLRRYARSARGRVT